MPYASQSFGGGCSPTYLTSTLTSSSMSATFADLSDWLEVDSTGAETAQPLGTSGPFSIKLDWGLATEETVKCTSLDPVTKTITFATRGFDGTTAQAHAAGTAAYKNVFPTDTATDWINVQAAAIAAQSTANGKVASVTAGDSSITVGGTSTSPTVAMPTLSPSPAGSWGSASEVPTITVDAKGRVTAGVITRILTTGTTLTTTATLVTGTLYPCDTTAGAFTVTLPNTSTPGSRFIAIRLQAGTNALTINAASGQTINGISGLTSIKLTAVGQAVFMTYSNGGAAWQIIGSSSTPATASGFAIGGDLTGVLPNPTVDGLQGNAVSAMAPTSGQALVWNGTAWTPTTPSATFSGEVMGTDFKATGLTGATAASRYVGGTTTGAPTSGTFLVGDFVVDQTATIWVCTADGTPGTWSPTESQNVRSTGSSTTAALGEIIIITGGSTGVLVTLPVSPVGGSSFGVVNNNNNSISIKGGTYPLLIAGNNYGAGISYTVSPKGVYLFVFDNVGNRWICTSTNDIGDMVNYSDVTLDKFGAPATSLPMGAQKITGLANGSASTDAAAFGQIPLLTDSVSSTSTTTAATPNSVRTAYNLANAALPLAGGTMSSGAGLNMNYGRVLVLGNPGSTGDAARAGDFSQTVPPFNHYNSFGTHLAAWTFDPTASSTTTTFTSNTFYFTAIYIPFSTTVSGVATIINAAGSGLTASGSNIGLFNATTCLAQTGTTTATSMFSGASGSVQTGGFVAPVTVTAGVYWIGHYVQFSTTSPTLVRSSGLAASIQNMFTYPTSGSLTNLRAATYGTNGSGSFPATGNAIPTGITAAIGSAHTFWTLYI